MQMHVTEMIRSLEDEEIRTEVFCQMHAKQRETFTALHREKVATQNASRLAFCPDVSTKEARQRALEVIRAEINGLQCEVEANKKSAGKLLCNAVHYAKRIGDRLLFAQEHLLDHGEYEDWVEDNFNGGLSTARAYTRIAKFQNWKLIAPKLQSGTLTIQQALQLIKKGPPEKEKGDMSRASRINFLKLKFANLIKHWSDEALSDMVNSIKFIPGIEALMEKLCFEIRQYLKKEEQRAQDFSRRMGSKVVIFPPLLKDPPLKPIRARQGRFRLRIVN